MENIRTPVQVWGLKSRTCAKLDVSQNEDNAAIARHLAVNSRVLKRHCYDGKCPRGKRKEQKEGRRTLGDFNHSFMAGPVRTVKRSPRPIPSRRQSFSTLLPQKSVPSFFRNQAVQNNVNKLMMRITTPPGENKPKFPSKNLHECLASNRRTVSTTKWETIDINEIDENDLDIEIVHHEFTGSTKGLGLPEITNNHKDIPYINLKKLEEVITPTVSQKNIAQSGANDTPKPRILQDIIYHEENFNVKKFLERSNCPQGYFLGVNRKCMFNPTALDFLKNSFPLIPYLKIQRAYDSARYNLSTTAHDLSLLKPPTTPNLARPPRNIRVENISQLQEMEFIRKTCNLSK